MDFFPINIKNTAPSSDMEHLFLNNIGADIHFSFIDSAKRLPAHKILLAKSSPVFKTAFYGSMPIDGEMLIDDVPADHFEVFLQFFYLNNVQLTMDYVQSVMELAHKFEFVHCMNICVGFLTTAGNLVPGEMCLAYQLAITFELNALIDFCRRKICFQADTELNTDGFFQCNWHTLREIVRMPYLDCKEIFVLVACWNWARHACQQKCLDPSDKQNLRDQLKDLIYDIRFKSVEWDELAAHIDATILYNEMELRDIICLMTDKQTSASNFSYSKRLKGAAYYWQEKEPWTCKCSKEFLSAVPVGDTIVITFSSDKTLLLAAIDCSVFNVPPSAIPAMVRHRGTNELDENIPAVESITFSCDDTRVNVEFSQDKKRIRFNEMLEIFPSEWCKVELKFSTGNVKSFCKLQMIKQQTLGEHAKITFRYSPRFNTRIGADEPVSTAFESLIFFPYLH